MSLATQYFWLVFSAAMGFAQVAAVQGGLKGLMLSQRIAFNRMLAGILIAFPAFLFFTWNYHNPVGIIEGTQQAGLFSLATLAALITTLMLSSVFNFRLTATRNGSSGLEALKDRTFIQAFWARFGWKR
jgi:hypothetical protein